MQRLNATQLDLLARHRAHALDVLLAASATHDTRGSVRATPAGRALLDQTPEALVSVAVAAAAASVEQGRLQVGRAGEEVVALDVTAAFSSDVLRALARRRLPFAAGEIELLLVLGTGAARDRADAAAGLGTLSFAVTAAERLLDSEPAPAALLTALDGAGQTLEALGGSPGSDLAKLRRRLRVLLAAHVPGGLLDLVVIDPRDAWAEQAREILRTHGERWEGLQRLVVLLAGARAARPTATWRAETASIAARYDRFAELLRHLLEPVLRIDLSSSGLARPPAWLLAPDNEVFVKGAAWAAAEVDEPWVVPLLGRLALRGGAASPHPKVTIPLSLPVARGAIEALAANGTPAAREELSTLLSELRRRDLLKRIAAIVGERASVTAARDQRIRSEKRRAIRRSEDPASQARQRRATSLVRRDLAPLLRDAGFGTVAGRAFRRDLDDRIEVVRCRAGATGMTLEAGIWFRFVPRPGPRNEDAGGGPAVDECDLRAGARVGDDDLRAAGGDTERWFARWRPLDVVLRWLLTGSPSGAAHGPGPRGSAGHALLTGSVARRLGETAVARRHLGHAATLFRTELDERRARDLGDVTPEWVAWLAQLEATAAP
jgi:hypothetical protein